MTVGHAGNENLDNIMLLVNSRLTFWKNYSLFNYARLLKAVIKSKFFLIFCT